MNTTSTLALIAHSAIMCEILTRVDTIARSDSSVLLTGETGVGKELFAEYIHKKSERFTQPFVKVGLSALPPELLESELFGHEKGAYTSAGSDKKGLFELADKGSIFLDDIDDFPIALQSKLLRVLESRELMRVGGMVSIPIDVRVICASKIDLKELIERKLFRPDLYYRINVVPIVIPPLRDRRDDIPLLIEHFLQRFLPIKKITVNDEAMQMLIKYSWPGNIRELRNIVQRISLFAEEEITPNDLPGEINEGNSIEQMMKACLRCFADEQMSLDDVVACLEVNLMRQALQATNGNKSQAAQKLKLNLSTFRDKLKKYNMNGGE